MAIFIYTIYTEDKWGMLRAIRTGRFGFCTMDATSCVGPYIQVMQKSGNCVDALDGVLDNFPNSAYVVDEDADKVIGGFIRRD